MTPFNLILLGGASITLVLVVYAIRAFRRSWRALLPSWYPHMDSPSDAASLATNRVHFWYGIGLLTVAGFVAYWILMIWRLSQA